MSKVIKKVPAKKETEAIINRISRIEGQMRGLKKMLEEKKDCTKVVAQVLAVREAVAALGVEILQNELVCDISERKKIDEKYLKAIFKMK